MSGLKKHFSFFGFFVRKLLGLIFNLIMLPFQLLYWILSYAISFQKKINRKENMLDEEPDATIVQEEVIEQKKECLTTVSVKTGKRLHIIPVSEIVCLQAYGDYVNIMTMQGIYLKEQTLKYFNEHLPETQFIRVHRSYIVNINAIETIERYGREQYVLALKNKEKVKATPEGYRRLKVKLSL
jgi:DNA-binding LytR/AlgR family response regulator